MIRSVLQATALAIALLGSTSIANAQGEGGGPSSESAWPHAPALRAAPPALSQGNVPTQPKMGTVTSEQNMGQSAGSMRNRMMSSSGGLSDRDFAAAMIPHHEAAISMAKLAIQSAQDPEVRRLAQGIIKAQEHEIGHLRVILHRLSEG